MRIAVMLVAAAVLAGCATVEGYRQQTALFVGQPSDALLVELGPPVSREPLSGGGEVWTYYSQQHHYVAGGPRTETRTRTITWRDDRGRRQSRTETYDVTVYDPPREWSTDCETRFVVGPDGVVRDFRFEGEACRAPEIR